MRQTFIYGNNQRTQGRHARYRRKGVSGGDGDDNRNSDNGRGLQRVVRGGAARGCGSDQDRRPSEHTGQCGAACDTSEVGVRHRK